MNPNETYKEFEDRFNQEQDLKFGKKLEQLKREEPLIPIKQEILRHADSFISWLDLSNEWFLKFRDLKASDEERKLNLVIYEFYKARADLILKELSDFLPMEAKNG